MQLFYNPDIDEKTETFFFDKEESRHIVKVLRKTTGDKLLVTNGKGLLITTEIALGSDNKCIVKIVGSEVMPQRENYLHLAVAPTKMTDRFEWFLEKATEIGIDEITPLICDHSERKALKTDRLEKIIQSAMKQSLQYYLPKFNEAVSFGSFLKLQQRGIKLIAHCEHGEKNLMTNIVSKSDDVTMLIGPEGDFSTSEIELAIKNAYVPVSLGNNRLRTETAAVVACHTVAIINQN